MFPIIISVLLIILIMTPVVGIESQFYFIQYILFPLTTYADFYVDNQSLLACIRRFVPDLEWLYPFFRISVLIVYGYVSYRCRHALHERNPKTIGINSSLFTTVSLLLSGTAWTAAHIRLLLPLVIGLSISVEKKRKTPYILAATILSVILYCYPQSYAPQLIPLILVRDYPLLIVTLIQFGVNLCLSKKYWR